jgi:DNA-binding HxlR family transcriptional regulator
MYCNSFDDDAAGLELLQRWMSAAGGKWALPILDALADEPRRYNHLLANLGPVAPKVLTQTLRRLEAEALVAREPVGAYGRLYRLTVHGRDLRAHLGALRERARQTARVPPAA